MVYGDGGDKKSMKSRQSLIVGLLSSLSTLLLVEAYRWWRARGIRKHLKSLGNPSLDTIVVEKEELSHEQLARNYAFLGEEGMRAVCGAEVVVVGLGGVGSHAAHMLLRSGVKRLKLIDFDQVTLSSLNRHAVATRKVQTASPLSNSQRRMWALQKQYACETI